MYRIALALKRKLDVQFSYNQNKTKMNKQNTDFLNGSEKSMIPILRANYANLSVTTKGMTPLEEFSAGTGIADLVLFDTEKRRMSKRSKKNIPAITNIKELEIINIIGEKKSLSEDAISERVGKSKEYTLRILQDLLDKNVVKHSSRGYSSKLRMTDSTVSKTVAIEAKVKDWKSGLRQAHRYKEFADYSYLALYERHSKGSLKRIELFKQLGIGLLVVTDDGTVREILAPVENITEMDRLKHFLASERFYSIVDETQESYVVRNLFAS
jgi:hypothetical protein